VAQPHRAAGPHEACALRSRKRGASSAMRAKPAQTLGFSAQRLWASAPCTTEQTRREDPELSGVNLRFIWPVQCPGACAVSSSDILSSTNAYGGHAIVADCVPPPPLPYAHRWTAPQIARMVKEDSHYTPSDRGPASLRRKRAYLS